MSDGGYWARLGLEGIKESNDDHPLGFHFGTIEQTLLPRLAVLRSTLTTSEQADAFNALWLELGRYCRQTSSVVDDLREMARDLKNMEDGLLYEWRDVRKMREFYRTHEDRLHFDPEVYKRSTIVHRDLAEVRFRVDWDEKAALGRSLDGLIEKARAREEEEMAARYAASRQAEIAKREVELLEQFGALYQTSPNGYDDYIPKNAREDMKAAEQQLVDMGFQITANGNRRCCALSWGSYVVYGDPRSGNSLRFNVYKGPLLLHTFWIQDKKGGLHAKLESQLSKLQEQDSATAGLLDLEGIAQSLGVDPAMIKWMIKRGLPVVKVGSVMRFDAARVQEWRKENP